MPSHNNAARHLIDGLGHRMMQLQRINPSSIVGNLGPDRLNRLVEALPDYISFMETLLTEARQQQQQTRQPRR